LTAPIFILRMDPADRQEQMDIFIDEGAQIELVRSVRNNLYIFTLFVIMVAQFNNQALIPSHLKIHRFIATIARYPDFAADREMKVHHPLFFGHRHKNRHLPSPDLIILDLFEELIADLKIELMCSWIQSTERNLILIRVIHVFLKKPAKVKINLMITKCLFPSIFAPVNENANMMCL
jgi:hypothetical protein